MGPLDEFEFDETIVPQVMSARLTHQFTEHRACFHCRQSEAVDDPVAAFAREAFVHRRFREMTVPMSFHGRGCCSPRPADDLLLASCAPVPCAAKSISIPAAADRHDENSDGGVGRVRR